MHVSSKSLEAFVARRAESGASHTQLAEERLRKTSAQVLRASHIARSGYYGYNNGETVTYNTRWVNIGYDSNADIATQASLHGVYDTRLRVFPGKLVCVHLYLRAADLETETQPRITDFNYEYAALFKADRPEIRVPTLEDTNDERPFPLDGESVQPDTQKWRELDYILGQIELSPR